MFSEEFLPEFTQSSLEDKFEFQDLIRSFLKDFHRMIKMNQHLKRIIKTSISMNESLDLDKSLEKISSEASIILNCLQTNIYIVDEKNHEFWTKKTKGGLERIGFSLGVLSHTLKIKKVLRIDDWKNSQFADIDKQFFKYKTMICSPINDSKGNIIGLN